MADASAAQILLEFCILPHFHNKSKMMSQLAIQLSMKVQWLLILSLISISLSGQAPGENGRTGGEDHRHDSQPYQGTLGSGSRYGKSLSPSWA